MKNLVKVLSIFDEDDFYLGDYHWDDNDFWHSTDYTNPLVYINGRIIQVNQDIWDEVKEWSNIHKEGLVLYLNESDQALYLLIYGGII